LLRLLARRPPGDTALVGARAWSAAEAAAASRALAARLRGSRVVAVLADNGPAWVIADLACQLAGVVHLPLPGFFSPGQLAHALEQAGADAVLSDCPERIGALDLGFSVTGGWEGLAWMRRICAPAVLPPGTAKISFTSGSTGAPKGVCLGLDGLMDTARAVSERLADLPLSSHLAALPLSLLLENVAGVYAPLLRGMPVHLPPLESVGWRGMSGLDPACLDARVRETAAASVILVPELLKAWTLFLGESGRPPHVSLRFVAVGGARVARHLLGAARVLGIPAYEGYGLTEAGSVVALNRPGDDGEGVGRLLSHARGAIDSGELQLETRAFLGYVGAAAVPQDAFPTGDLALFDERGHLHLAGRRKNLLITSLGRNVSPEWVESALLAEPAILQAVVCGDGEPALAAVVVPSPGSAPGEIREAVARVNRGLPDYARIQGLLLSEPFSALNGLATGNGRPRRERILAHHAAALAALYHQEENAHVVL
jgi:long-subunit acyl-CoA synthetase (AMP-forming)